MALVFKTTAISLVMNYAVHVGSSFGYHEFCIPHTLWEVAQSLISTASPVCTFLLNTMQATQSNYATMVMSTVATTIAAGLRP